MKNQKVGIGISKTFKKSRVHSARYAHHVARKGSSELKLDTQHRCRAQDRIIIFCNRRREDKK
jgi:hypothetical protein